MSEFESRKFEVDPEGKTEEKITIAPEGKWLLHSAQTQPWERGLYKLQSLSKEETEERLENNRHQRLERLELDELFYLSCKRPDDKLIAKTLADKREKLNTPEPISESRGATVDAAELFFESDDPVAEEVMTLTASVRDPDAIESFLKTRSDLSPLAVDYLTRLIAELRES